MKIKLAILFGGKSTEHEVSVISALQAVQNLDINKYELYLVYISKTGEFYSGADLSSIENYADLPALLNKCQQVTFVVKNERTYIVPVHKKLLGKDISVQIDVAFPITHGTNVEDGALQGYLRSVNLPFVGCDVLQSALCMDKYAVKIQLESAGFPVVPGLKLSGDDLVQGEAIYQKIEQFAQYPLIVKPVNLGSSVGISKAADRGELVEALKLAATFASTILIEPAVQNLKEINCSVLGSKLEAQASICEEPISADKILSYKDKYMSGGKSTKAGAGGAKGGNSTASKGMSSLQRIIPADISDSLSAQVQQIAVDVFKYLELNGVVRIDFLYDQVSQELYLNEINTIPGSLSFYLWEPTGISYRELLDKLIKLALDRHRLEQDYVYSFDTNILSQQKSFGSKGTKS